MQMAFVFVWNPLRYDLRIKDHLFAGGAVIRLDGIPRKSMKLPTLQGTFAAEFVQKTQLLVCCFPNDSAPSITARQGTGSHFFSAEWTVHVMVSLQFICYVQYSIFPSEKLSSVFKNHAGISLLRSLRFRPRNGGTSDRFKPCSCAFFS